MTRLFCSVLCFLFKQTKYAETWKVLFGRERPWARCLEFNASPTEVLSPTRKETAVVTDVAGADSYRVVCIQISQAVSVF